MSGPCSMPCRRTESRGHICSVYVITWPCGLIFARGLISRPERSEGEANGKIKIMSRLPRRVLFL